jgi:hypothetical protein
MNDSQNSIQLRFQVDGQDVLIKPQPKMIKTGSVLDLLDDGRYFTVDVDGTMGRYGHKQRPAAERKAKSNGLGLWDAKTQDYVVEVNVSKRAAIKTHQVEFLKRDLAEAERQLKQTTEAFVVASSGLGRALYNS